MKLHKLIFFFLFAFSFQFFSQVNSIKNGTFWRDTAGNRINAHGVAIIKHQGIFYMIGNDMRDAFTFKGINLYASTDLMNWEFKKTIIDKNTNNELKNLERITERPCLIYNALTNTFVVWVKYQNASYTNNKAAVFYASTIDGSYTYDREFFPKGYDSNDASMFVDTDGKAYYVSTNKANQSLNLYTLTDNFRGAEDATVLFSGQNKEAPVIFKKDNIYYMLSSTKTGWDPNQMQYSTSTNLKSGWSSWKNVGNKITFDSQPTDVLTITGTAGTNYYYVGDRWRDPDIRNSKTVLFPLTVNNGTLSMNYVREFKINLTTSTWSAFDDNAYVPKNNWSVVSVSSQETVSGNFPLTNVFDGNKNTIWHSRYNSGQDNFPHEFVIDLGASYSISGLSYVPRLDNSLNGILRDFQLFLSEDGINWGAPVASGWLGYWSELYFQQKSAKFMKFVALSDFNETSFATASEIKLIISSEYTSGGINSYYNTDSQGWKSGTNIQVNQGSQVQFGPQAQDNFGQTQYFGTFSWHGPNGYYFNGRAPVLNNIQSKDLGTYTVFYLDDKFNVQKQAIEVFSNTILSTKNINLEESQISVYPNPAKDILTIKNADDDTLYKVYNILGKELIKNTGKTIDISKLDVGYYVILINNKAHKFVKE
ncbi:family 43 glycosylhydrolase [Polaribacter sp. L3A8]|uniref:family 43 glycosylhydrolase n=1 Tax=Polaribacter sp. L3A8 TaxID=2686361 RepID=UPI00131C2B14|nr:family 43 glycosylhydrolase [Polaribacter sp. L3A8]